MLSHGVRALPDATLPILLSASIKLRGRTLRQDTSVSQARHCRYDTGITDAGVFDLAEKDVCLLLLRTSSACHGSKWVKWVQSKKCKRFVFLGVRTRPVLLVCAQLHRKMNLSWKLPPCTELVMVP